MRIQIRLVQTQALQSKTWCISQLGSSRSAENTLNKENWHGKEKKMKDKRVQKEADFFPLFHVKLVILHSALSCNRELDGGGRLNNPARFCPSRAKAHCSDGNENILEMKRTFSPSPRLNFLARLFISAISAPLRARSPSQAFIFTRCPFNAPFSSFFSPSRMRRGCDFITDPESDYHQGDPMRLNYKEVGQDKHLSVIWFT